MSQDIFSRATTYTEKCMWFVVRKNLKDSLKEKWFVEEVERLDWNSVWGQHMLRLGNFLWWRWMEVIEILVKLEFSECFEFCRFCLFWCNLFLLLFSALIYYISERQSLANKDSSLMSSRKKLIKGVMVETIIFC